MFPCFSCFHVDVIHLIVLVLVLVIVLILVLILACAVSYVVVILSFVLVSLRVMKTRMRYGNKLNSHLISA